MLCTLLGSHPSVLCHHELFNPAGAYPALELRDSSFELGDPEERDRDPLRFLDRVWLAHLGHSHVGFKMTHRQNQAILSSVLRDRDVRKIVLRRENRLRTFVSRLIAEETGQWEVYDEADLTLPRPRVHVDVPALRQAVAEDEAYYGELETVLDETRQPFLGVRYEALVAGGERARLLEFLELPEPSPACLSVRSARQNPAELRDLVVNFTELEAALAGTELAGDLRMPDPSAPEPRAASGLVDRRFVAEQLTGPDPWCASHGAAPDSPELGAGMLYYALAYALRASVCVCLGSGGGFVPRLMRQAQRDLGLEPSRTILVDGGDRVAEEKRAIWGSPAWTEPDSWFRRAYPDVEIVLSLTEAAHRELFIPNGITIDYLHIDADHHYEGVRLDFDLFAPILAEGGVITLHDSSNYREPCGVPRLVEELRGGSDYAVVDFPIRYGTTIVKRNPA